MEANIKWLDDPEVFRINQLPAHSDHRIYASKEEEERGISSLYQSLNGTWQFCYSKNAKLRPVEFYKEEFNRNDFDEILVPGHIELADYDKIHYINTMYPWEGHEFRRPAYTLGEKNTGEGMFSGADYNPVGSYVKSFKLEEGLKGKKVSIFFEGVEQAMYIWLNGEFVGYAEDSFTPSEFDLTPYLKEENILAVEVHKRSTAAFLEDQDFFRFFGIFRDVTLIARGDNYIEDLWIRPTLLEDKTTGNIEIDLRIKDCTKGSKLKLEILDVSKKCIILENYEIKEEVKIKLAGLENVSLWSNHEPSLYTVIITTENNDGKETQFITYPFGFRRIEIKDKIMLLNGERLIINGVNRHEWSAKTGRVISEDEEKEDIAIIKKNSINAVRTSHYPNRISWYFRCDYEGIYLMAETNLESHGSYQKMGKIEPSYNVPGANPKWLPVVMDRAKTNFETFKNHTGILFWSLGNESYAEENIRRMNEYFKQTDSDRLVHYEGNFANPNFEDSISDIKSRMYAKPCEIIEYLENNPTKPFILCEYMHDMGNSLGGMKSYMQLLDKYPMYQGGFIWDYIDQALFVKDEVTGKEVLRYGGDFDDRPSDYEFSGNGIVFANREEKPAMQEVKYYYGKYDN